MLTGAQIREARELLRLQCRILAQKVGSISARLAWFRGGDDPMLFHTN